MPADPKPEYSDPSSIHTEKLAYWFFRLNGCLLIENFIVHPLQEGGQQTDIDILGVRFPFRQEITSRWERCREPMQDFGLFAESAQKPLVIIAEVKLNEADLNKSAKRRDVLLSELDAIGVIPDTDAEAAAAALSATNRYEHACCSIRMFVLCDQYKKTYQRTRPELVQITWTQALTFIHKRFRDYRSQKADHWQWDEVGSELWTRAQALPCKEFVREIRKRLWDGKGNRLCFEDAATALPRQKKRAQAASEPSQAYEVRHINTPGGERIEAFWVQVLTLYDTLLQRRRAAEGDNPTTLIPAPPIDTSDSAAMTAEATARYNAVMDAPEITSGEKNTLLKTIIEKIVPNENALEITCRQ